MSLLYPPLPAVQDQTSHAPSGYADPGSAATDQPPQPYSPFRPPVPASIPIRAVNSSRRARRIAIAGFGLVVAGIVAFAVLRDNEPSRSRDEVIKRTFAALAAGDEQALFALADPVDAFTKIARCEKVRVEDDKDPLVSAHQRKLSKTQLESRDPKKLEERWRMELGQLLRRTKNAKLEVVDILTELPPPMGTKLDKSKSRDREEDDRRRDFERYRDGERDRFVDSYRDDEDRPEHDKEYNTTTYRKGTELGRGCYAKMPFRQQQVKVVVDIKEGDRELSQRVKLNLLEIDGSWYLSTPPSLNVGFDVVIQDLQDWRDKTCKCTGAECVDNLDTQYGRLAYVQYDVDKSADVPSDLVTKIEKLHQERKVCEGTARGGPELARYKAMKDAVCACKDDECGRKIELEMVELRRQIELTARAQRFESSEITRQLVDVATAASECTRKLAQLKPRVYSVYPASGEITGGTIVSIRGSSFLTPARTAKVLFGTKEATDVRIVSDYEIVVEAPPADGEGFVELRIQFEPGGQAYAPAGFTYQPPLKRPTKSKKRSAAAPL
jgi:hypothetical protein